MISSTIYLSLSKRQEFCAKGSASVNEIEHRNKALLRQYFPGVLEKLDDSLQPGHENSLSVESLATRGTEVQRFSRGSLAFFGEPPYHAGKKAKEILNNYVPLEDISTDTIICIGSTFVTLIKTLLDERKDQFKSIIVLEPDPEVFIQVIKTTDLSGVLGDARLKILVSSSPLDCADALATEIHPMRCKGWTNRMYSWI
jgi:hypothetical protein